MCGAIPPLPQYVFMACCSVKHRTNYLHILPFFIREGVQVICKIRGGGRQKCVETTGQKMPRNLKIYKNIRSVKTDLKSIMSTIKPNHLLEFN
jgi:hypothetical protein